MSDLEIALKELIDNYKKHGEPINIAIQDISREFGISEQQACLYVEMILGEESDGSIQFKDSYIRSRFLGK